MMAEQNSTSSSSGASSTSDIVKEGWLFKRGKDSWPMPSIA